MYIFGGIAFPFYLALHVGIHNAINSKASGYCKHRHADVELHMHRAPQRLACNRSNECRNLQAFHLKKTDLT